MKALILTFTMILSASFSFASVSPISKNSANRQREVAIKKTVQTTDKTNQKKISSYSDSTSFTVTSAKPTANPGRTDGTTCPYAAKKQNASPFNRDGKYTVADAKAAKQVQAAGPQRGTY